MYDLKCTDVEEKLSDYIERALGTDARGQVDAHIDSCRSCRELLDGMTQVMDAGAAFPIHNPPPWLAARIAANTPPVRVSFGSLLSATWKSLGESRTALAIFTAAVVLGWIGSGTARVAIFDRAEGVMSCAYDHAVRSYYRSPVIIEIHSKLGQLREDS